MEFDRPRVPDETANLCNASNSLTNDAVGLRLANDGSQCIYQETLTQRMLASPIDLTQLGKKYSVHVNINRPFGLRHRVF